MAIEGLRQQLHELDIELWRESFYLVLSGLAFDEEGFVIYDNEALDAPKKYVDRIRSLTDIVSVNFDERIHDADDAQECSSEDEENSRLRNSDPNRSEPLSSLQLSKLRRGYILGADLAGIAIQTLIEPADDESESYPVPDPQILTNEIIHLKEAVIVNAAEAVTQEFKDPKEENMMTEVLRIGYPKLYKMADIISEYAGNGFESAEKEDRDDDVEGAVRAAVTVFYTLVRIIEAKIIRHQLNLG
jgi:hypothetical protein